MDTIDLIKDVCLFGGTLPNERVNEVKAFLDKAQALQLLQTDVIVPFYCYDETINNATEDWSEPSCKKQCEKCKAI